MKKLIILLTFLSCTFNAIDVTAQTKPKTKKTVEPVAGEAPVKDPVDTILGFAMFDGMSPLKLWITNYQLRAKQIRLQVKRLFLKR